MRVDIFFDGACKNVKDSKKEPFGVGVACFIDDEYSSMFSIALHGEKGTSNVSEWAGCISALRLVKGMLELSSIMREATTKINIYSDSQLITNQFNGTWEVKQNHLKPYAKVAKLTAMEIKWTTDIVWVRRELNVDADLLSKVGLKDKTSIFNL